MKAQDELKEKYGIMFTDMKTLGFKYDTLLKDLTEIKDTVKSVPMILGKLDTCSDKILEQVSISKKQQESITKLANKDAKKSEEFLKKVASVTITVTITAIVTFILAKAGIA